MCFINESPEPNCKQVKDARFLAKKKKESTNILFYKKKFKVDIFIVTTATDPGNCKPTRIDTSKRDRLQQKKILRKYRTVGLVFHTDLCECQHSKEILYV